MADTSYKELTVNGLWKNNSALVQLLGLCPLLAVSSSVVNALGLGLATALVLATTSTCVSLVRSVVSDAIRLPVFVMIIAATVSCIELLMQAMAYELYLVLGIFLPLITTNCIVLGRADAFASKNRVLPSMFDGFMMGLGFGAVLVVLGALRELAGTGALFADMHLLFGDIARDWQITVIPNYDNFLLAILPPGAFIFTGLLIALKNIIDRGIRERQAALQPETAAPESRRVRVTGNIS